MTNNTAEPKPTADAGGQNERLVRHFMELKFTVVATPDDYKVDYRIYDHEGVDEGGNVLFHKAGSLISPDWVEATEESEPYISGHVKWDGCSSWNFNEQDRTMLHGCCKDDVVRFGLILGECWDMAKELCPKWG